MSVTTTSNTATQGVMRLLADYDLTHTGDFDQTVDPTLNGRGSLTTCDNPPSWPMDYNAVPPYRPINYNLDRDQRPWGSSPVETAFVWTMLNGVGLVACTSKIWRQTGGRINSSIFRYSVGGER